MRLTDAINVCIVSKIYVEGGRLDCVISEWDWFILLPLFHLYWNSRNNISVIGIEYRTPIRTKKISHDCWPKKPSKSCN